MTNLPRTLGCLTAILILISLAACRPTSKPANHSGNVNMNTPAAMTTQEKNAVAGLQWLNNADPIQAARSELAQAAAQGRKPTLMAFAGRGLSYPGLKRDQLTAIEGRVAYKIADGSGDVIYGMAHREMRQKLRAYAIAYNQMIAAAVQ